MDLTYFTSYVNELSVEKRGDSDHAKLCRTRAIELKTWYEDIGITGARDILRIAVIAQGVRVWLEREGEKNIPMMSIPSMKNRMLMLAMEYATRAWKDAKHANMIATRLREAQKEGDEDSEIELATGIARQVYVTLDVLEGCMVQADDKTGREIVKRMIHQTMNDIKNLGSSGIVKKYAGGIIRSGHYQPSNPDVYNDSRRRRYDSADSDEKHLKTRKYNERDSMRTREDLN